MLYRIKLINGGINLNVMKRRDWVIYDIWIRVWSCYTLAFISWSSSSSSPIEWRCTFFSWKFFTFSSWLLKCVSSWFVFLSCTPSVFSLLFYHLILWILEHKNWKPGGLDLRIHLRSKSSAQQLSPIKQVQINQSHSLVVTMLHQSIALLNVIVFDFEEAASRISSRFKLLIALEVPYLANSCAHQNREMFSSRVMVLDSTSNSTR